MNDGTEARILKEAELAMTVENETAIADDADDASGRSPPYQQKGQAVPTGSLTVAPIAIS